MRYVFFFKQKTAYEMRISDWSSDVCSSDLLGRERGAADLRRECLINVHLSYPFAGSATVRAAVRLRLGAAAAFFESGLRDAPALPDQDRPPAASRSEEHTSELQSLMRISYAVFCLKKKTN